MRHTCALKKANLNMSSSKGVAPIVRATASNRNRSTSGGRKMAGGGRAALVSIEFSVGATYIHICKYIYIYICRMHISYFLFY